MALRVTRLWRLAAPRGPDGDRRLALRHVPRFNTRVPELARRRSEDFGDVQSRRQNEKAGADRTFAARYFGYQQIVHVFYVEKVTQKREHG
jgi:hypothetical protein